MGTSGQGKGRAAALGVFTALALAGAVAGYLAGAAPAATDRFYLRNASGAVLLDHAAHKDMTGDCRACHHEAAGGEPQGCRACHPATAPTEPPFRGCAGCHDDPEYQAGAYAHEDLLAVSGHECAGCHAARSLADACHGVCNACHLEAAPERFADADGAPLCRACHLR